MTEFSCCEEISHRFSLVGSRTKAKSPWVAIHNSQFRIILSAEIDSHFTLHLQHKGEIIEAMASIKVVIDGNEKVHSKNYGLHKFHNNRVGGEHIAKYIPREHTALEVKGCLNYKVLTPPLYKSMYLQQDLSDVTIIVDGERLPAHKLILSMHSPVFRAMFNSGMKESTMNEIIIDDYTIDVVKEFLKILYHHECRASQYSIDDRIVLLQISHKYDVFSQVTLQNWIQCYISIDNWFKIWKALGRFAEIEYNVLQCIAKNLKVITRDQSSSLVEMSLTAKQFQKLSEYL